MFSKNLLCVQKVLQIYNIKNYLKFNSLCILPEKLSTQKRILNSSIEIANRNDFIKIKNIINNWYNKEDPLMKVLNINENLQSYDVLLNYWMNCLENGISFKAINNADNSIIGFIMNCRNSTWSNDYYLLELKNKSNSMELKQLFTIWNMLGQTSDLQNKYKNCKIFEISTVAVINQFQSYGMATKLFQNSLQYGQDNGFDVARTDCTNYISSKIARNLNMELVWEMSYNELFDIIGISKNKLPKPPHTYIQTYVFKYNNNYCD